jgi:REP element-mobilizing transposase RayT
MDKRPETTRFYRMRLPHWEVVGGRYFVTMRLRGSIPAEGLQRIGHLLRLVESAVSLGCSGHEERRRALAEMERWLHAAPRVFHLADPRIASCVTEAIQHREKRGVWKMFNYVIMPNHLHLFFRLGPETEISSGSVLQNRRPIEPATTPDSPRHHQRRGSRVLDERAEHPVSDHAPIPAGEDDTPAKPTDPIQLQRLYLDRVIMDFKRWTATRAAEVLRIPGGSFWQREWFDHWSRSLEEDKAIQDYIRCNPLHACPTQ